MCRDLLASSLLQEMLRAPRAVQNRTHHPRWLVHMRSQSTMCKKKKKKKFFRSRAWANHHEQYMRFCTAYDAQKVWILLTPTINGSEFCIASPWMPLMEVDKYFAHCRRCRTAHTICGDWLKREIKMQHPKKKIFLRFRMQANHHGWYARLCTACGVQSISHEVNELNWAGPEIIFPASIVTEACNGGILLTILLGFTQPSVTLGSPPWPSH